MALSDVSVHYASSFYEDKITELEGYAKELEQHLENLEGFRGRIMDIMDDENGAKYSDLVAEQIKGVRSALARVKDLRGIYQKAVNDFNRADTVFGESVEEGMETVKALGLSGD